MRFARIVIVLTPLAACAPDLAGPTPEIAGIRSPDPAILCRDAIDPIPRVTVRGSGFAPVVSDALEGETALVLPAIAFVDGRAVAAGEPPPPLAIVEVPAASVTWISDEQMSFPLPPIDPGVFDLRVTNPDGSADELDGAIAIVGRPVIDAIEPAAICTAQFDNPGVVVVGRGFLFTDAGGVPELVVGERVYPGADGSDCVAIEGPGGGMLCRRFTIAIPLGDLPEGTHEAFVRNPAPAECASSFPAPLVVVPPPVISGIEPSQICAGRASVTVVVSGENFRPGAGAIVDGSIPTVTTFVDDRTLLVEFSTATLGAGQYDLTVQNPDGCSATATGFLDVLSGAFLFFVDPPVIWNGIVTQVTIYGTSISGGVTDVAIQPHGDPSGRLSLSYAYDPTRPGRVQAEVPSGLAAGPWDVLVRDGATCEGMLESGLTIVDRTDLALIAVEPEFGWTGRDTAVTVTADASAGFEPSPRLYLSPVDATMVATALRAVAWSSSTTVTAVVPAALMPGSYDVIAVNPSGTVGVLPGGFTVTSVAPPTIDDVSPGSIESGTATNISISGADFDAPTVTLRCVSSTGAPLSDVVAPVGTWSATAIAAQVPAVFSSGTVCVVRVTNAAGPYADFSALAITNPSSNLEPFVGSGAPGSPVTAMTTPRRGLAVVAGRATGAARFLYAIGGDGGSTTGAMATIESSAVDLVGRLGPWAIQRNGMTTPRTLVAAARVDRFVYAVGGHDGAGPLATVERARILDPLDVPAVNDVLLDLGAGTGLAGGAWIYRVAAVRDASDPSNPGGETLPSEPVNVTVPELPERIHVTLRWTAMPGAVAYRVYRTPTAGTPAGTEELVAETVDLAFTDDGATTQPIAPLGPGALGVWHVVATLSVPRAACAVATAASPVDPAIAYLYVAGGLDDAGAARADVEVLTIAIAPDGSQIVSGPTTAGVSIGAPRWQLNAFAADHRNAPSVAVGETYVYVTGGRSAVGTAVSDIWVGRVGVDGALVDARLLSVSTPGARCGGAGAAIANGFLFLFGGGGAPSTGGHSAEICSAPGGGCPGPAPELRNFNSLGGGGIAVPRYLMGTAIESAFVYVVGGASAPTGDDAVTSTERTIW